MSTQHPFLIQSLCALSLLSSLSWADEQSMNKALDHWAAENKEYQAALKYAKSDEERAELLRKGANTETLADALWKSISKRVGYREVEIQQSDINDRFSKKKSQKIPIYGYEQSWAAPAVCWLINHPQDLQKVVDPSLASKVASALLKSITNTHYDQSIVADICATIANIQNIKSYECLEKIYMRNPHAQARACAALGMSILLQDEQVRNNEGSEEMAKAKRIYYIKAALNIAPEKCMFGDLSLDEVAIEQIYRITKLGEGNHPPTSIIYTVDNKKLSIPLLDQAQLIFFWSPHNGESIQLIKRFKALSEKYPLIKIIAIAPPITRDELRDIYQQEAIDYPTSIDKDLQASKNYRIPQAPYVLFVDENSKLLYLGPPDLNLQTSIGHYIEGLKDKQYDAAQLQGVRDSQAPTIQPSVDDTSVIPELREMPEL